MATIFKPGHVPAADWRQEYDTWVYYNASEEAVVRVGIDGSTTTYEFSHEDDTAFTPGDFGVLNLAVRKDAAASLASADGDYTPFIVDSAGKLYVAGISAGGSAGDSETTYSTANGRISASIAGAGYEITLGTDNLQGETITYKHIMNGTLKIRDASDSGIVKTITLDQPTWTSGTKILDITNCEGAFSLATTDEVYLALEGQPLTKDLSLNVQKTIEQTDTKFDMDSWELIVSASDVGATDDTWVDQGAEMPLDNVGFFVDHFVYTANDSSGAQVQYLVKYESAGADEFELLDPSKTMFSFMTDGNRKASVRFNCAGIAYVQRQTKATDVDTGGGTEGTITITTQKFYGAGSGVGLESNESIPFFDSDVDNTAQSLKTDRGCLKKLHVVNTNNTSAYVQLFNVASGSVTVGTTTPDYVLFVPAEGAVIEDFSGCAMSFDIAITYAATTTATGSIDPTAGLILSALYI